MIKQKILSSAPIMQKFFVDDWQTDVYIRLFSGAERAKVAGCPDGTFTVTCCLYGIGEESGARVFKDSDLPILLDQPARTLDLVAMQVLRHNKMTAEDIEELKKKSSAPNCTSGTNSPSSSEKPSDGCNVT